MEPGRSSLLTSAFVSMTTRSLAFNGKDFGQLLRGHPSRGRTLADAIAPLTERLPPREGGLV